MVSAAESLTAETASESETASDTYPFGLESYVSSCGLEMSFSSIVVWSGLERRRRFFSKLFRLLAFGVPSREASGTSTVLEALAKIS